MLSLHLEILDSSNSKGRLTKDARVYIPSFVVFGIVVFTLLCNNSKLICFWFNRAKGQRRGALPHHSNRYLSRTTIVQGRTITGDKVRLIITNKIH